MDTRTPRDITGLGAYMREVASKLDREQPMTYKDAHRIITYMDEGYAAAVLVRLRMRGIATEDPMGYFTRGPRWSEAAIYYKWGAKIDEDDSTIPETESE